MTSEQPLEGGLAEPAELEPDQGALALADPSDGHTRAEWEAAAAAVLRKGRRLADDDPDSEVWARLTRTTLDGVPVPPLGTPELLDGLVTSGRPTRVGGWDVVTRPADNEQALRFYRSLGFRDIGLAKEHVKLADKFHDEIYLEKDLGY